MQNYRCFRIRSQLPEIIRNIKRTSSYVNDELWRPLVSHVRAPVLSANFHLLALTLSFTASSCMWLCGIVMKLTHMQNIESQSHSCRCVIPAQHYACSKHTYMSSGIVHKLVGYTWRRCRVCMCVFGFLCLLICRLGSRSIGLLACERVPERD